MNGSDNIHQLERAIRTNVRITSVLMIVTLLFVIGASGYAYWRVNKLLEPENVAQEAEQYVNANYPEWRNELKQEIVQNAPRLAERMSKRTLKSIPEARQRVERRLDRWTERGLERAHTEGTEELRQFVRRHKDEIRQAHTELKQSPEESSDAAKRLEAAIKDEYGINMQSEARRALEWIRSFNQRLREVAKTTDPSTDVERTERRIARLLRAMETQEAARLPMANRSGAAQ